MKPNVSCSACNNKRYSPINSRIIESHLRGDIVIGVYPLLEDETCNFLAVDFDKKDWQESLKSLYRVCREKGIDALMKRSRSGNGGHLWIFFQTPIPAVLARKLGTALLNCAMNQSSIIFFDSYDRFFPNQDTMPKGNLGNLIALPLQKKSRIHENSVFVDENFRPYESQWELLKNIKKISMTELNLKIADLIKEDDIVVITRKKGSGNGVYMPLDFFNRMQAELSSYKETTYLLSSNANKDNLLKSIEEHKNNKLKKVSIKKLDELNLD